MSKSLNPKERRALAVQIAIVLDNDTLLDEDVLAMREARNTKWSNRKDNGDEAELISPQGVTATLKSFNITFNNK